MQDDTQGAADAEPETRASTPLAGLWRWVRSMQPWRRQPAPPSSARTSSPGGSGRPFAAAALLLAVPFVTALVQVLIHADSALRRTGDEAPFEARLLTLFEAPPLVGPYSRHQWNHPGPLIFWLFGLPYRLLGRSPVVVQFTALALNLAALGAAVRSVHALVRQPVARAFALAWLGVLVAKVSATLDPSGLAVSWSPSCTLLPFAVLVLVSAELGVGRWERLQLAVLLHGFVTQTQVVYAVPATLALAGGIGLGLRAHPTERRDLFRAGALLGLLWAPVAYDQFLGSGNLGRVAAFFLEPRVGTSPGLAATLSLFSWRATEPLREVFGLGPPFAGRDPLSQVGQGPLLVAAVAVLSLVALLVRGVITRRTARGDPAFPLAAIPLVLLVTAVPTLLRLDKPEWPYLTWWVGVIAVVGAIGAGATLFVDTLGSQASRRAQVAAVAAVGLVGLVTSAATVNNANYGARRTLDESEGIVEIFPVLEQAYACRQDTQLTVESEPLWGVLGAGLVHLGRSGIQGYVDRSWEFMFGPGYAGGSAGAQLVITGASSRSCRALDRGRWLRVADCRGETGAPGERGEARQLTLTPWRSLGARGDPGAVLDAERPADGSPWNAPGTVVLERAGAELVFGLPVARLSRVSVTSDDNDVYLVQHSRDGHRWEPLTELRPTGSWGLRTHAVELPGGPTPLALRIVPVSGDGSFSVGDVRVDGEVEALRVSAEVGVVGDLALVTDGRLPRQDATLEDLGAVTLEGLDASLTLELPAIPVEALVITASARRAFLVEGAEDGVHFRELGRVPAVPEAGFVTRRLYLDRDVLASHLRVKPLEGEGPVRIAELAPLRAPGAVVDVGCQDASPALRSGFSEPSADRRWAWIVGRRAELVIPWPLLAGRDIDVMVSLAPFVGLPAPGTLTVRAGSWSRTLKLNTGPQTVRARIPADTFDAWRNGILTLSLEPSEAQSPQSLGHSDDRRELSVAVHRVEVRPAPSWCAP